MTYLDELILKKRDQEKMKLYSTLEKGIYLDGKIIEFESKIILDSFLIMLPKTWETMPDDFAKIKYPSEFRPQVIITTLDLSVNLGFTVFPNDIKADDLNKVVERIRAAIHRAAPNSLMYPCENMQNVNGCWFAFRSHAMDSDIYNMMLMSSIKKGTIQGSFNCLYKDYLKWQQVVLKIWNSIVEWEGKL